MMQKRFVFFISIFCLALSTSVSFASENDSLYQRFSRVKEVKVYIAPPSNPTNVAIDPSLFQKKMEENLKNRKSVHFAVVSEQEAQIKVESQLLGYHFSEVDPVDMLGGVGMAALDAAKQDHFAAMEVDMKILEAGKIIWNDRVRASVTDEKMTEAESKEKVLDKAANMFLRQAFGRK